MANGSIDPASVIEVVSALPDPETGQPLGKENQVRDAQIQDGRLRVEVALTTWAAPVWPDVEARVEESLRARFPQLAAIAVHRTVHERPAAKIGEIGLTAKSVIAVGSGKGGVGKSTAAVSLALGLKRAGCKVGLMDADVYGPSVPHMLGLSGRPTIEDKRVRPIDKDGMPVMSMGFLVARDEAVIWRGPMLHGAVTQFLRDTAWGDLDYLIIDMPPGTGDIALTLSQLLPLTGAVIVCTPQDVALLDAVKAIAMFRKVRIPVLGLIENMSGFICPGCGQRHDIFGSGGARRQGDALGVPFLGDIPIQVQIREFGDDGRAADSFENPEVAARLEGICYRLVKGLADAAAKSPPQASLPVLGRK